MRLTKERTYIMITEVICDIGNLQEKLEYLRDKIWDAMTEKQRSKTYKKMNWLTTLKIWDKKDGKEKK